MEKEFLAGIVFLVATLIGALVGYWMVQRSSEKEREGKKEYYYVATLDPSLAELEGKVELKYDFFFSAKDSRLFFHLNTKITNLSNQTITEIECQVILKEFAGTFIGKIGDWNPLLEEFETISIQPGQTLYRRSGGEIPFPVNVPTKDLKIELIISRLQFS